MSVRLCSSCGEFALRREEHWSIVDPERQGPVEHLCQSCVESYGRSTPDAFVFFDPATHTVTLLSDTGLRLAHLDAERDRLAA